MSLWAKLVIRLLIVALGSFFVAIGWVVADTTAAIHDDLAGTEIRISYQLERMHRSGNGNPPPDLDLFRQSSIEIVLVMAPGTCAVFTRKQAGFSDRRLCAGWNVFGEVAPGWFRRAVSGLVGPFNPIEKDVPIIGAADYHLRTSYDPVAAMTRIWQQVRIASGLTAGLAIAIALISALVVTRTLQPVSRLVRGLRALEAGELKSRLPRSGTREFDRIAGAIDDLAARLESSVEDRKRLMKRLFAVQEEERRNLARDLHDEFGQCLTAAGALAASIEGEAGRDKPGIAGDARAIARIHQRMMATLRGAFTRLRPPDLSEIGMAASLDALIAEWNASVAGRTRFELRAGEGLDAIPDDVAIAVYRVVQEGLTNAARHAEARHVLVHVDVSPTGRGPTIEVVVTDDGIGDEAGAFRNGGSGLIGMRERVAAVDGSLEIVSDGEGTRIAASIPLAAPPAQVAA